MSSDLIQSGVPGLGDVPWGSHYCNFYESREDLVDTLVPYFKAGLEHDEACLWITCEPFTAADARAQLGAYVPDLAAREARGQIEILDHREAYLRMGSMDAVATVQEWVNRQHRALAAGYRGLRLSGNTCWLQRKDWASFMQYEQLITETYGQHRMLGLCSYCVQLCSSNDVLDVIRTHQSTIARHGDHWHVVETAALGLAREDLLRVQQAAELLRASDRRKDEFLAVLGHELRNPLAPIHSAVQLMKTRETSGRPDRELAIVERQVRHMSRLVDDLLDVSRIGRGKVELRRERVEVADAVARAVEVTRPLLDQLQHTLRLSLAPHAAVYADADRLTQVLVNLLTNAAKYTPPRGTIEILAAESAGAITISVRDDGLGIDAVLLPQVFDLFVQGDRGLDRAGGGLELGLPIVKSLVELQGGTTELTSSAQGTVVSIRLPSAEALPPAQPAPVAVSKRARSRVLLVDDNEDAGELLAVVLRRSGYDVQYCCDGPSALAALDGFAAEVAVLDIGMPAMDGYELARRMHALPTSGLRLIALTGYGTEGDRKRSREAGFAAHLVKPVDLEKLLAAIES